MVNVTGKARVVRYIARIDEVNDGEYEGVFLHKVSSCLKDDCISFFVDEKDDASFFASDIVFKLPPPVLVGGTARHAITFNHVMVNFYDEFKQICPGVHSPMYLHNVPNLPVNIALSCNLATNI